MKKRIRFSIYQLFIAAFLSLALSFSIASPSFAADEEKAEASEEGGFFNTNKINYISMNPIVVPILSSNGEPQIVTLVIAIEVKDSDSEEKVLENKIRLTDAYITDMYGVLDNNRIVRNGFINVKALKARLNKITTRVLGEDVASNIMIKALQQRRV